MLIYVQYVYIQCIVGPKAYGNVIYLPKTVQSGNKAVWCKEMTPDGNFL